VGLSAQQQVIPRGSAVFVENMPNGLDGFIRAALFDRQVPLRVVLRREEAHLVIAGESTATQKTAWHEGWLTGAKDKAEGNVMVFDRATKTLIMTHRQAIEAYFGATSQRAASEKSRSAW
jgi:hypothetical protein